MTEQELKARLKQFALRVMRLVDALPRTLSGRAIGMQLVRAGTSVGANYRAACRARSTADFISKLGIAEEEADESEYWLELIAEGELLARKRVQAIVVEAGEILRIMIASRKTAERRQRALSQNPKSKIQSPKSRHVR